MSGSLTSNEQHEFARDRKVSKEQWKIEGGGLGPVDQRSLEFLFAARACHIVYVAHDEAYL